MPKLHPTLVLVISALLLGGRSSAAAPAPAGWGVDACISIFAQPAERPVYLENLRAANVSWLRERGPVPTWAEVKAGGVNVVGFTSFVLKPQQKGNQLPEDLLAVFHAAEAMQRKHGLYVDAWEMIGEPDVGYCRDLPDRLAAYQKAVYLGIKRAARNSEAKAEGGDLRPEGGGPTVDGESATTVDGGRLDGRTVDGAAKATEDREQSTGYRLPSHKRPAPFVLMGALALPPGPWLERATRNGLLDYTDAYNFHFYGHAKDLTSVIDAHAAFVRRVDAAKQKPEGGDLEPEGGTGSGQNTGRAGGFETRGSRPADPNWGIRFGDFQITDPAGGEVGAVILNRPGPDVRSNALGSTRSTSVRPTADISMRAVKDNRPYRPARRSGPTPQVSQSGSSPLPLWITEAGLNAVDPDDFLNPARRQLQADFTVSTAQQALAHPDVAMFMPFILVHKGDGHALTLSADKPLPAWDAYAAFTRANPWPQRPLARVPENPNPIVVQWLPDNKTTVPHKVSGTYRFWGKAPIVGEIRVYNFSEAAISGKLRQRPETGDLRPEGRTAEAAKPQARPEGGNLRPEGGDLRPEGGRSREAKMASQQRWPKGPTKPGALRAGEEADLTERSARRWRSKPEGPEKEAIAEQKTSDLGLTKSKSSVHVSSSLQVSGLSPQVSSVGWTADGSVAAGASTRPDVASRVEDPKVNDSEIEGRAERPAPPRRTGPVRPTLDISTRAVKDNRPYQPARRSGPTSEVSSVNPQVSALSSQVSAASPQVSQLIAVPAMSMVSIPITITAVTPGYFREYLTFEFVDETGRVSPLYFGVERPPVEGEFVASGIAFVERDSTVDGGPKATVDGSAKLTVGPVRGAEAGEAEDTVDGGPSATVDGGPAATVDGPLSTGSQSTDSLSTVHRADEVRFPLQDDYTVTSTSGPWVGINGLEIQRPEGGDLTERKARRWRSKPEGGTAEPAKATVDGGPGATVDGKRSDGRAVHRSLSTASQSTDSLSTVHRADSGAAPVRARLRAHTPLVENDPLRQTLAVARIAGLPKTGFLYLKTNRPMNADFYVRVDLLDRQGQRFAIWENLGVSYYGPQNEAWLNLEDFQHYIWTGVTTNPRLDPTQVEEIQLRFYFKKANDPVEVEVEVRQPRTRLPEET